MVVHASVYRKVPFTEDVEELKNRCFQTYGEKLSATFANATRVSIEEGELSRVRPVERIFVQEMPRSLVVQGYDRLDAIYASPFPFPSTHNFPSTASAGVWKLEQHTALELYIDASAALVLPLRPVTLALKHTHPENALRDLAQTYWAQAQTLEEFQESTEGKNFDFVSFWKNERVYYPLEVLIPSWSFAEVHITSFNSPTKSPTEVSRRNI